ncbi:FAD-binding oxidoreductase [Burkholderia multivorans]|uniref:NAD(P)/FAD-dependent oxidoreductase n=1 Tax=Burkholderia multivorans TaxID=87883 RepID=UPI001C278572|nr:FAD-binding oxidoreductase [Burkholderia multivorans]MBU9564351.1 FAD-binding oxidoreductase [Burkholderia multivorans]
MHVDETATYYTATAKYALRFPSLEDDLETDVVIIGGGFSGIHTALELAEHGLTNTVVLEARHLGYGGSGRNGGHVMVGVGHDLDGIRRDVGEDGLKAIFALNDLGPQIMRERIAKYNIQADIHSGYGYLAFNARQARTLRQWETEFASLGSPHEIRYLEGSEVRQIIGSDVYRAALLHNGCGHVHSLNLLLGEAQVVSERYGVRIFEHSPALQVTYGDRIHVRTAKGSIRARQLVWAVDGFNNRIEPELHRKTLSVWAFNSVTEPLPVELIERISPIRGAYSDIRPVIDYFRVTRDNRLMFGTAHQLLEYMPSDLHAFCRARMLKIFPYLADVRIDMAWGGPLPCSLKLFPQLGTLADHPNVFYVQGYSGFGVTPSQLLCKILAEGIMGGSDRYRLLSSIDHRSFPGKDHFRALLVSLGKLAHQTSGYFHGRR